MIFTEQLNNWYLRTSVDFTEYDFKIAVSPFKTDVSAFNPIPTGHGRNQPMYECHMTTAGRNRVNTLHL